MFLILSPACSGQLLFSVSSALQAAAGAAVVMTGSGLAVISAGPIVPSGQQVASPARAVAAVRPKGVGGQRKQSRRGQKQTETTRQKCMDKQRKVSRMEETMDRK